MSSSAPPPKIHTYHCLCSTLLLATPYDLSSSLPRRAAPSLDRAFILPLPLTSASPSQPQLPAGSIVADEDGNEDGEEDEGEESDGVLPSILTPQLRPGRKVVVVRRADGFERRRVWRCGRCGVGVGYEVLREGGEGGRVLYLVEGGLVETEEMGRADGG